ncbi:unnamed protein product [Effrenium voratum]|uniref:Uncharacterized protein n=1 Tax=Effrenium voratum TaxID=2562239 RepID=A0AA36HVG1_9DINO|nr:unnamed protein product [Effrenium voratum]CAJ1448267.1 unnamed protein product [Effrenium voratum]CAJ1453873.1 unnamed protein product [Effrenium voratum]
MEMRCLVSISFCLGAAALLNRSDFAVTKVGSEVSEVSPNLQVSVSVGSGDPAVALSEILMASLRAMGVTGTIIVVGILAARWGIVGKNASSVLSAVSANLAIPALLFSRIIYCDQCNQGRHCPECAPFSRTIASSWILMVLPLIVVGFGLALGKAAAVVTRAPAGFARGTVCAIAFGSSTSLPIVLLSVVTETLNNVGSKAMGKMDPLLHLPVYLILYPVLMFSIGNWLLRDPDAAEDCESLVPVEERRRSSLRSALRHALEPPVLASIAGLLVGLTPVRALLVDVYDQDNNAWLEWLYNGIYELGNAAVPLNLLILGCSLSKGADFEALPPRLGVVIVLCKLVLMPLIMTAVIYGLIRLVNTKDTSLWLVALLVTCMPTANNVAVMAQTGGQSKEGMATAIFLQYMVAPVSVSLWLAGFLFLLSSDGFLPTA